MSTCDRLDLQTLARISTDEYAQKSPRPLTWTNTFGMRCMRWLRPLINYRIRVRML